MQLSELFDDIAPLLESRASDEADRTLRHAWANGCEAKFQLSENQYDVLISNNGSVWHKMPCALPYQTVKAMIKKSKNLNEDDSDESKAALLEFETEFEASRGIISVKLPAKSKVLVDCSHYKSQWFKSVK